MNVFRVGIEVWPNGHVTSRARYKKVGRVAISTRGERSTGYPRRAEYRGSGCPRPSEYPRRREYSVPEPERVPAGDEVPDRKGVQGTRNELSTWVGPRFSPRPAGRTRPGPRPGGARPRRRGPAPGPVADLQRPSRGRPRPPLAPWAPGAVGSRGPRRGRRPASRGVCCPVCMFSPRVACACPAAVAGAPGRRRRLASRGPGQGPGRPGRHTSTARDVWPGARGAAVTARETVRGPRGARRPSWPHVGRPWTRNGPPAPAPLSGAKVGSPAGPMLAPVSPLSVWGRPGPYVRRVSPLAPCGPVRVDVWPPRGPLD